MESQSAVTNFSSMTVCASSVICMICTLCPRLRSASQVSSAQKQAQFIKIIFISVSFAWIGIKYTITLVNVTVNVPLLSNCFVIESNKPSTEVEIEG